MAAGFFLLQGPAIIHMISSRMMGYESLVQDSKRETGGSEYKSEKLQIGLGKSA